MSDNDILDRAFPGGDAKDGERMADACIAQARYQSAWEIAGLEAGYVGAWWGLP